MYPRANPWIASHDYVAQTVRAHPSQLTVVGIRRPLLSSIGAVRVSHISQA
jgi:hypothetical protein